jgi:hypothetical protein
VNNPTVEHRYPKYGGKYAAKYDGTHESFVLLMKGFL